MVFPVLTILDDCISVKDLSFINISRDDISYPV